MRFRNLFWAFGALVGIGVPAAALSVVHRDHGAPGLFTLIVLTIPALGGWFAAQAERRRSAVVCLAALAIAAWSCVAYATWQWTLFSTSLRNLESMRAHGRALGWYHESHGTYPATLSSALRFSQLLTEGSGLDEWGHPFVYEARAEGFLLVSHGRGGKPDAINYWHDRESEHRISTCGSWSADQVMSDRGFHRACGK